MLVRSRIRGKNTFIKIDNKKVNLEFYNFITKLFPTSKLEAFFFSKINTHV